MYWEMKEFGGENVLPLPGRAMKNMTRSLGVAG